MSTRSRTPSPARFDRMIPLVFNNTPRRRRRSPARMNMNAAPPRPRRRNIIDIIPRTLFPEIVNAVELVRRRRIANTPVNRSWNNLNMDPISLQTRNNWGGNRAIETKINNNGHKTYFHPNTFRNMFGNNWKNMAPNSNHSIHPTRSHPLTRGIVRRKNVKLVRFV